MAALLFVPACAPTPPADPAVAAAAPAPGSPAAAPAGTGLDECAPLALVCESSVASRHEGERAIVYITPAGPDRVRPGQWFHCVHDDRPPSPPCQLLDFVDSGMLEASCLPARPAACAPS